MLRNSSSDKSQMIELDLSNAYMHEYVNNKPVVGYHSFLSLLHVLLDVTCRHHKILLPPSNAKLFITTAI